MSGPWHGSVWTEAGQVRLLLEWPAGADDRLAPDDCFARLRARRRGADAASFLAVAMPRYEAVLWAARGVYDLVRQPDADAMATVTAWLRDPSEARRRDAEAIARTMRTPTPERLCAWAAFMAGGSVAPEGSAPFLAPRDATGRFAAAAVILAAAPHGDAGLDAVLDAGARMAETMECAA
ncbi:MAG: hypothetical protein EOP67_01470 [Sphingomonas sp.]|jgi:hypothetical protein|uniref:DUF6931 family protein n=1 Tax=Sphingomonas sp. Leaf208 TaxID=1735679 RepID=UPI0006F57BDC|nr:hypothetical protein [Sphingomonas sp. Leaf208]KQM48154.1 hypothetical protein ASE69_12405 [Sphingomonas sp. Leaf208]RZM37398.1 MAG: hypothetical protein EOP67_01470 [Sphingomonas sp.]